MNKIFQKFVKIKKKHFDEHTEKRLETSRIKAKKTSKEFIPVMPAKIMMT